MPRRPLPDGQLREEQRFQRLVERIAVGVVLATRLLGARFILFF